MARSEIELNYANSNTGHVMTAGRKLIIARARQRLKLRKPEGVIKRVNVIARVEDN